MQNTARHDPPGLIENRKVKATQLVQQALGCKARHEVAPEGRSDAMTTVGMAVRSKRAVAVRPEWLMRATTFFLALNKSWTRKIHTIDVSLRTVPYTSISHHR